MIKTVVVVDDNKDVILFVKKGLEELDSSFRIVGMQSGKDCFKWLEKNPNPDMILLDIMMPEMNGWHVFKLLKENEKWKDIPVCFLTAKTDNFSRSFGKILAQNYIEKPVEIEDLKKIVDTILEKQCKISETKEKIVSDVIKKI